jgi:2-keto-4-pentenoate hydratase/2-oxohepta-3-ene-1,7-dioic acid hydratase in catechol pathway
MKILRFNDDRIGVIKGDKVVDISDLISHRDIRGPQGSMDELIGKFDSYRPKIEALLAKGDGPALSSVKLLVPLPHPGRVMAAFANYLDRPDKDPNDVVIEFFHKSPYPVGPGGTTELPDVEAVRVFHAEAELAFVMGKNTRNVSEAAAMDHVFGYIPFFDISARGLTRRSQLLAKGQESFAVCGPWITTRDEIADPHNLNVRSWVSGKTRQDYSTRFMAHKIPVQVSWLSRFVQLRPCDMVATGVYHEGLGPINPGDTLEIEIEGLGRAKFNVGGSTPRKDIEFTVGGGGPGGGPKMSRV